MAAFRTHKIRQRPPFKPIKKIKKGLNQVFRLFSLASPKQRSYFLGIILVFVGGFVVLKVTTGIYEKITNFDAKEAIFSLGSELKQDENGFTNLVLLGDGGHVRDGADLIDTIMVASLDSKRKSVSLFSIPRDYYLRYISNKDYAGRKINEIYRDFKKELGDNKAFEVYQDVAGDIVGLELHYYARIDFNAFVEVVDSIGGITVDVKEAIYDPQYPNETDNGYTVFQIDAGLQEMNGETALKFVRSRKTTSDFSRAARQQQVLMAIKEKATSNSIMTSPGTIKRLYSSIQNNLNTNLSLREMIAMASFAKRFDQKNLVMKVIHDDPGQDGGFLYTPERKYYNGQFVLVPDGNSLDLIHVYANLIFHHREALMKPAKIEVLNATKVPGIARQVASDLNRFGFNTGDIDNLYDSDGERKYVDKSFIRYNRWEVDRDGNVIALNQPTIDALQGFARGEAVPSNRFSTNTEAAISIVLGEDYNQ